MSWWRSHQLLFAERNETANKETGIGLNYWLDPRKPFNQIHEEIKALHLRAHSLLKNHPYTPASSARYPIYKNVSSHTLHKTLTLWDLHLCYPDMSKYDLGIKAGLKPNLMPDTKYGERRTRQAMQVKAHNQKARTSIANQTSRCLRTARQYIENVGKGEFPKALGR